MKNKNYTDENWLREQYTSKIKSIDIIACECGCSKNTVWVWLRHFNIFIRQHGETLKLSGKVAGKNHPLYGKHHKPESIEKMRQNVPDYSGNKNPFFNKHHTDKTKLLLSTYKKRCWGQDEFRKKRTAWLLTDEARKIAISNLPKDTKGDKHYNWRGGSTSHNGYGWEWIKIRKTVLEIWGYKCLNCGMSQEESIERFGEELHIHHITPFNVVHKHDLFNLIPLCIVNHSEVLNLDKEKEEVRTMIDYWFLPKPDNQALEQLAAMKN